MDSLPASLDDSLDIEAPPSWIRNEVIREQFRLWLNKLLACHILKRQLWRTNGYPSFSVSCCVCFSRDVEVAFIGCGHCVCCGDCGRRCLYGTQVSSGKCPLCRMKIIALTDDL